MTIRSRVNSPKTSSSSSRSRKHIHHTFRITSSKSLVHNISQLQYQLRSRLQRRREAGYGSASHSLSLARPLPRSLARSHSHTHAGHNFRGRGEPTISWSSLAHGPGNTDSGGPWEPRRLHAAAAAAAAPALALARLAPCSLLANWTPDAVSRREERQSPPGSFAVPELPSDVTPR